VLDLLAKPTIRRGKFDTEWKAGIEALAQRQHVHCKFSGLVTEIADPEWTIDLIRPYWEVALEAFGADRLLFGSDWPVCLLRSDYERWVTTVETLAGELSRSEQAAFWGQNAKRLYGLDGSDPR
jgi:L-fuconolactonase